MADEDKRIECDDHEAQENCSHDCDHCSHKGEHKSFKVEANKFSHIKKIIGVVSGKGGVGKSFVTGSLASALMKKGYSVGILDADITGPSIPKMFGITNKAMGNDDGVIPEESKYGIEVMSINLLLPNDTDPVIWRGPMIASYVQQFYTEILWGELDYLLIDMPPGTGDVPLTIFQSLPVDGIVVVTSPQDLVSMIVGKAIKMANMMNVNVLGIVENYSYFHCPDNGKDYEIFGTSKAKEVAESYDTELLARIPINPEFAKMVDRGLVEELDQSYLEELVNKVKAL